MIFFRSQFKFPQLRTLSLVFLLLRQAFPASAQYNFAHYNVEDGLNARIFRQFAEDKYGFIWIATDNGLYRYDGHQFKGYFANPSNKMSLPNNDVSSISFDKKGDLWIGTWGGVAKMESTSGLIRQVPLNFVSGHVLVQYLKVDTKNRLWVATWLGLYLFDDAGQLIKHWRKGNGTHDLPHEQCNSIFEDPGGRIWIGTTGGLCLYREDTRDFEVYLDSNPAYTKNNGWMNSTGRLWMDPSGIIWFGGWANGLKRFNPKTGRFSSYLLKPEFAGHGAYNVITDVASFDGKFWVASHDQGLGTFDSLTNTFDFLKHKELTLMNLPAALTNSFLVTAQSFWIGTSRGLYAIHRKDQFIKTVPFSNIRKGTCLPDITDVSVDPANADILYISTWTCGLFRFDLKKGIPEPVVDPVFTKHANMDQVHILRQLLTKDSSLFLATSHGIFYKKRDAETYSTFITHPEIKRMPDENYTYSLLEDDSGMIWAATRKGILVINPSTMDWKRISRKEANVPDGLKDVIIDITQNSRYIFFLRGPYANEGGNGLTIYDKANATFRTFVFGEGKFKKYPSPKTASRIMSWKDRFLVVSSDAGLVIFDPINPNGYLPYSTFHGLHTDHLYDLAIDKEDRIWVQSEMGLNCINPGAELFTLGQKRGLPDITTSTLRVLPDGRLVCGFAEHYLVLINSKLLPLNDKESKPIKPVLIETENGPLSLSNHIELPQGTRYLRFQFSDFSFSSLKSDNYTVSVIHNKDTVRYISETNQIELSNLEPGKYEFLIERGNSKGLIRINNPYRFYEIPWFRYSLSGLLILILGAFIIKIQKNKFLKKQRMSRLKLQLIDYEMKSLRAQMNDHFVFNALTGINRFIYDNKPQEATNYLTKFAKLLRLNIRGTRNTQISLEEDLEAIRWYFDLESLKLDSPPKLEFIIQEGIDIHNTLIPPMLIQPLVENSLRHGASKTTSEVKVWIDISCINQSLIQIRVIDNAPSFNQLTNEETVENSGLSLSTKIIQERFKIMNEEDGTESSKIEFNSSVYSGFNVTVAAMTLPIKRNL